MCCIVRVPLVHLHRMSQVPLVIHVYKSANVFGILPFAASKPGLIHDCDLLLPFTLRVVVFPIPGPTGFCFRSLPANNQVFIKTSNKMIIVGR